MAANTRHPLRSQQGALQSQGVVALAGFVPLVTAFWWVPYLWRQSVLGALLYILTTFIAFIGIGCMINYHEARFPIAVVLSLPLSMLIGGLGVVMTIMIAQPDMTWEVSVWAAITAMHLPSIASGVIIMIVGRYEARNTPKKMSDIPID